jgi:hypothetical protein
MLTFKAYKCEAIITIRQNLYVFDTNITPIKTLGNVQKLENMNSMPLFMPKKLKQDMHATF